MTNSLGRAWATLRINAASKMLQLWNIPCETIVISTYLRYIFFLQQRLKLQVLSDARESLQLVTLMHIQYTCMGWVKINIVANEINNILSLFTDTQSNFFAAGCIIMQHYVTNLYNIM